MTQFQAVSQSYDGRRVRLWPSSLTPHWRSSPINQRSLAISIKTQVNHVNFQEVKQSYLLKYFGHSIFYSSAITIMVSCPTFPVRSHMGSINVCQPPKATFWESMVDTSSVYGQSKFQVFYSQMNGSIELKATLLFIT